MLQHCIGHETYVQLAQHVSNLQGKFLIYMPHGQLIIQFVIMCNMLRSF